MDSDQFSFNPDVRHGVRGVNNWSGLHEFVWISRHSQCTCTWIRLEEFTSTELFTELRKPANAIPTYSYLFDESMHGFVCMDSSGFPEGPREVAVINLSLTGYGYRSVVSYHAFLKRWPIN